MKHYQGSIDERHLNMRKLRISWSLWTCLFIISLLLTIGCQASLTELSVVSEEVLVTNQPEPTAAFPSQIPTTSTLVCIYPQTATAESCDRPDGEIIEHQLYTPHLQMPLEFIIYLPPCYDEANEEQYPVLYLLHGQSMSNKIWIDLDIETAANNLMGQNEIPAYIIVMPNEDYYLLDPWESNYGQAVVESLIPWIDSQYHTCTNSECRAIGGISRGAGWAMRLGLMHWDIFGAIGAHSYPVFRGDYNRFPGWFKDIPQDALPKIYIDIGLLDRYLEPASQFEALLTKYKYPHEWHTNTGTHDEIYWRAHMIDYLKWYGSLWLDILE